jgi:MFS transporter, putative metabolite:H+ symporter
LTAESLTVESLVPDATGVAAIDRIPIAQRLDRLSLTRVHIAIFALCTLGLAADIGEVALSNTFSAIFLAAPYNASRSEVSWLLAAVFAGGAVGAPAFGWWGDRGGRRTALQTALVVLAFGSLAVALSPNIAWMTAFRLVSGLALGAYPPLTAAYLADVLPPSRRGLVMMLCGSLAFLGAPAMIFLIRWLTPLAPLGIEGWRWALLLGTALSAATAGLFFLVPESPRWLAALGRSDAAERSYRRFEIAAKETALPLTQTSARAGPTLDRATDKSSAGAPDAAPRNLRRAFLLAALYALGPWATIGFPLLSAAVMVQKGFRVGDSLLFAGLSMFGPTLGIGLAAFFVDRIARRLALILCAGAMTAIGLAFAAGQALTPLILLGFGFNLASAVYSAVLSLYGAELFPTRLRALATSAGWGAGRVVSALVPIALLPLLGTQGPLAMFTVIAAALLASALLILTAGPPGLARRPVA